MGFEIRAATRVHLPALVELAGFLDSVNLPDEPSALEELLELSERSFAKEISDPARRQYVFVLWDVQNDRPVGTSMVIGQLGRRDAPYIYFGVSREEKYSATLDRHFVHTILTTCFSYEGPTEIGGLVVHPAYRLRPERLGTLASYVRFLFLSARRGDMQREVLAELMPPLEPDGRSHLWEAVGRRFTGLTYRAADRLSRQNKEFIRGLFPDSIYATLLPLQAQRVIGEVGEQTRGVEKMLSRIGFRYAQRVDPFDGGPHFLATLDDVTLVRACRALPSRIETSTAPAEAQAALVAFDSAMPPYFRARLGQFSGESVFVPAEGAQQLAAVPADRMWILPIPLSTGSIRPGS